MGDDNMIWTSNEKHWIAVTRIWSERENTESNIFFYIAIAQLLLLKHQETEETSRKDTIYYFKKEMEKNYFQIYA